jgi:hypothetical protein
MWLGAEVFRMTSLEELQAKKLEAEIKTLEREATKADQEILQLKRERISRWKDLTWWRDLGGILSVVATLIYGVVTFLDQQQKKHEFEVTQNVITLAEKLHATETVDRKTGAILLSAYGTQVVPILLNFVSVEKPAGSSGLATALTLIAVEKPSLVLKPARERAESFFKGVSGGDKNAVDPLINHIVLLGDLAGLGEGGKTRTLLSGFQEGFNCSDLESAIGSVDKVDRRALCSHISQTIAKVGSAGA